MTGRFCCLLLLAGAAQAQQWQPSLASTASLRTGGAHLVSSDALTIEDGKAALITYWEARTSHNLDVYRCVDVVDATFTPISQQCWSALRPSGRGPSTIDDVRSSHDLCGRPDNLAGISEAAYCAFDRPFVVQTPYFALMVEPLEDEGLVSVSDDGHTLFLTSSPWPSSAFFEVRMIDKSDRAFFAEVESTREILDLVDADIECELATIADLDWAVCRSTTTAGARTYYRIAGERLYEVAFSEDVAEAVRQRIERMFVSLDPASVASNAGN